MMLRIWAFLDWCFFGPAASRADRETDSAADVKALIRNLNSSVDSDRLKAAKDLGKLGARASAASGLARISRATRCA